MRLLSLSAVLFVAAALGGCRASAPPTASGAGGGPERVEQARGRWDAAAPAAYRFTLHRSCFCPPEFRGPFLVTVRDGHVAAVEYEGAPIDAERALTVDDLFTLLAEAYGRDAERVEATFDPDLGYPTSLFVDYEAQMADEEVGYTVTALRPLSE